MYDVGRIPAIRSCGCKRIAAGPLDIHFRWAFVHFVGNGRGNAEEG